MTHVFIVGSKGIPAKYGGFETFVENLTLRKKSPDLHYHVSCMGREETHFIHNGADCFSVRLPLKGAPGRILHVAGALKRIEKWKSENPEKKAIVYILGCRIGPFMIPHARKLHRLGISIFVNPDGLEWKRDKWNRLAKKFLKYCESCLVRNADLVICDSIHIEKYIQDTYPRTKGKTKYIAYGADIASSPLTDDSAEWKEWRERFGVRQGEYYLIVGRFVPENNYETMITEFMKSKTNKDLVIVTNVEKNGFYLKLKEKTGFDRDKRVKFVGTVYDQNLLKKIRECAFAYLHGHEVGGTNPSLLEAMASTKVNLLLDVGFNREVGGNGALYWRKSKNDLACLIEKIDGLSADETRRLDKSSTTRVKDSYNWDKICGEYEKIFDT